MLYLTSESPILSNIAALLIRLMLGVSMSFHGAQKLFGWFGGKGVEATVTGMSQGLGVPSALIYLSILTEFFGGLAMLTGAGTRIFAFMILINMLVATSTMLPKGFGGGFELPLTIGVLALAVLLLGPGMFSLDHLFFANKAK